MCCMSSNFTILLISCIKTVDIEEQSTIILMWEVSINTRGAYSKSIPLIMIKISATYFRMIVKCKLNHEHTHC